MLWLRRDSALVPSVRGEGPGLAALSAASDDIGVDGASALRGFAVFELPSHAVSRHLTATKLQAARASLGVRGSEPEVKIAGPVDLLLEPFGP